VQQFGERADPFALLRFLPQLSSSPAFAWRPEHHAFSFRLSGIPENAAQADTPTEVSSRHRHRWRHHHWRHHYGWHRGHHYGWYKHRRYHGHFGWHRWRRW
jgi:hypothetical protein